MSEEVADKLLKLFSRSTSNWPKNILIHNEHLAIKGKNTIYLFKLEYGSRHGLDLHGVLAGKFNNCIYDASYIAKHFGFISEKEFNDFRAWLIKKEKEVASSLKLKRLMQEASELGYNLTPKD